MKRLAYRTVLASLLTSNGFLFAILVPQGHALARVLGAVFLLYTGTVTFVYACGAAWHVGRADACRWWHRQRRVALAGNKQHAAAMAAVAADTPLPERTGTVAFTAVMPVAKVYSPWARKITQPSALPWTAPARHGREPVGGGVR